MRRIGASILGAVGGFFLGFVLFNLVFAKWCDSLVLLIIIAFGLAILVGFVAYKWDKLIIVYLTAFVGAYALVRGVSLFAGNFPNEITSFQEIVAGTFVLSNYFYIYLAAFAVTTLIGSIVQRKLGFHESHHVDDYYKMY